LHSSIAGKFKKTKHTVPSFWQSLTGFARMKIMKYAY